MCARVCVAQQSVAASLRHNILAGDILPCCFAMLIVCAEPACCYEESQVPSRIMLLKLLLAGCTQCVVHSQVLGI